MVSNAFGPRLQRHPKNACKRRFCKASLRLQMRHQASAKFIPRSLRWLKCVRYRLYPSRDSCWRACGPQPSLGRPIPEGFAVVSLPTPLNACCRIVGIFAILPRWAHRGWLHINPSKLLIGRMADALHRVRSSLGQSGKEEHQGAFDFRSPPLLCYYLLVVRICSLLGFYRRCLWTFSESGALKATAQGPQGVL